LKKILIFVPPKSRISPDHHDHWHPAAPPQEESSEIQDNPEIQQVRQVRQVQQVQQVPEVPEVQQVIFKEVEGFLQQAPREIAGAEVATPHQEIQAWRRFNGNVRKPGRPAEHWARSS
jgi:hypothetical protein